MIPSKMIDGELWVLHDNYEMLSERLYDAEDNNKKLESENELLKLKNDWHKAVEEGEEYPEQLNSAMVRISATLSHLKNGNTKLAIETLEEFIEGFEEAR